MPIANVPTARAVLALVLLLAATAGAGTVERRAFGKSPEGQAVDLFVLKNAKGMVAEVTNYGAILVKLTAPDKAGQLADVVLGFDDLEGYLKGHPFFGATVGRYGNRIAKGSFSLDGQTYSLAKNNGPNHLHGGTKGFDKAVWSAEPSDGPEGPAVKFSHVSPDGNEGYPGTLKVSVTYTLTDAGALRIDYEATTDKATPVALTHHSYFNLAGQGQGDVLGHELTIHAEKFTPVDATLIPTGDLAPVAGTALDFRKAIAVGARIDSDEEQIQFGGGYDHNFVVDRAGPGPVVAAQVREPKSGRVMTVTTTEPGVQFYTGNFLDGSVKGKGGVAYGKRTGLCLETQRFPDSPNKPAFPNCVLRPGETLRSSTTYAFSTD